MLLHHRLEFKIALELLAALGQGRAPAVGGKQVTGVGLTRSWFKSSSYGKAGPRVWREQECVSSGATVPG